MQLIKNVFNVPSQFEVDDSAAKKAEALVSAARLCEAVTNAAEQDTAVSAARDIRTWVKEVRKVGKELRDPLNTAAKKIIELENRYCAPLEAEQERIERLVADFQAAERKRAEEAERKRLAEIAEAERIRAEAEAKLKQAEESLSSEADLQEAIRLERQAKEAMKAAQAALSSPVPEVRKASGASTRRVLRYEVVDVHALYLARPELVKLEPRAQAILSTCTPENPVPGLKLWWEDQTVIRAK
jgi:hypothetical protein